MWWNENYPFRRPIEVIPPIDNALRGHPVSLSIPIPILATKVRIDLRDVVMVYQRAEADGDYSSKYEDDAPKTFNVVPIDIKRQGGEVLIHFELFEDLSETSLDEYYLYYGNTSLKGRVRGGRYSVRYRTGYSMDLGIDLEDLPMKIDHDGVNVTYTRPGYHWRSGRSNHKGARATFMFYGMNVVRLISEVGEDQGIIQVRVDKGPWTDVDLFSTTRGEKVVYEEAIEPGFHEMQVRVSGRQNESSIGTEVNVRQFQYTKSVLASDGGEQVKEFDWAANVGGVT